MSIRCGRRVHCVEEVQQARTAVPIALMVSVAVNGVLGLAMCIAVMFTIGDLEDGPSP